MTIGNKITEHRKALGLTQEALAQKLGVTNQAVSKWESDQCCPDIQLLPQLADVLGISIDGLFGRPGQEKIVKNDLPWEDDNTLRAVIYIGHTLVDGHKEAKNITFTYEGPALNVDSAFAVHCGDVGGNVDAGTDVACGDVAGSVDAGTNVSCGDVSGNASAGCDANCGDVEGNVTAGCDVSCGDVGGKAFGGVTVHIHGSEDDRDRDSNGTYEFRSSYDKNVPDFVKDMLSNMFGRKKDE